MPKDMAGEVRFQAWLAHMDDGISEFLRGIPKELSDRLNASIDSIDELERWLIALYPSPQHATLESEASVVGGASRYVGEILRRATSSEWRIDLEDRSMVFFGLPFLTGGKLGPTRVCPLSLVTASLDRRTGHYMSRLIRMYEAR